MKAKHLSAALLLLGACLTTSTAATAAQFVRQGDLDWYTDGAGQNAGYSIDRFDFEVLSESAVTLDVLSVGAFAVPIDSEIRIAINSSPLQVVDFFAFNDDGPLGDDGSILAMDSYYSETLAVGNYSVFIGGCCFSSQDAIDGLRVITADANTPGELYGSYQLTLTGDIAEAPVPLPPAFGLYFAALGILSLSARRRLQ